MSQYTIPLCTVKYVGDVYSSATFKYDTRERILKRSEKLLYKKRIIDIEKNNMQLFYRNDIAYFDNSSNTKLLYNNELNFNKNINLKEVNGTEKDYIKVSECRHMSKNFKDTDKNSEINLSKYDFNFCKDNEKQLLNLNSYKSISIDFYKELHNNVLEFIKENFINVDSPGYISIDKNTCMNFKNDVINEVGVDTILEIERLMLTKEMFKFKRKNIIKENIKNLNLIKSKDLEKTKEKSIDSFGNILFNDLIQSQSISKLYNFNIQVLNNNLIDKDYKKTLGYKNNTKDISKLKNFNLYYKNLSKDIYKYKYGQLLPKNFKKEIFIDIGRYNFYKNAEKYLYTIKRKYLNKINLINTFKIDSNYFNNLTNRIIFDNVGKELNNVSIINICNNDKLYGLLKGRLDIYKHNKEFTLSESKINITKNIYKIIDLGVIRRWWVLGTATNIYDKKILPYDYNYSKNPLSINSRIAPYGCLINQDKHPISYMPYLENNIEIDLNYGLDELYLSVEIMLEMINILGMIIHHSASQFANCSGQESIEFIMEVLLDWLNLDSTIKEMNIKNSREHYLRTYRWIRWEAEKIWLEADKDHSIDKMMGIKYANMLLSNLLDYMKYHHFNLVPIWKNLKNMDIERQLNRESNNGDIIKRLDKLKSRRHYYIETQNKI